MRVIAILLSAAMLLCVAAAPTTSSTRPAGEAAATAKVQGILAALFDGDIHMAEARLDGRRLTIENFDAHRVVDRKPTTAPADRR